MHTPESLRAIVGKRPWKVWKGYGSFLLFEFGRKRKAPTTGTVHGEYCLWIYMADWRMKDGKREIAHSESEDDLISAGAGRFVGRVVEAFTLSTVVDRDGEHYAARFCFEGGLSLNVFMRDDERDGSIFMFHTPKLVVSYEADGKVTEEKKDSRTRRYRQPR